MKIQSDRTPVKKSKAAANSLTQAQTTGAPHSQFVDNRSGVVSQRKLKNMAGICRQSKRAGQLKAIVNSSPVRPMQKITSEEEDLVQGKFETVQRVGLSKKEKDIIKALGLDEKGGKSGKILKKRYKANNKTSLFDSSSLQWEAIDNLTKSKQGKKWLKKAGLKTTKEVQAYAEGKDFTKWEKQKPGFKMQVATMQYALKLKNTPGYQQALSALGRKDEIYQHDADVWEKTLTIPEKLDEDTKKALTENNNIRPRNVRGNLGSGEDLQKRQAAAMQIVKRIFVILQQGLKFRADGQDFKKWDKPVAVALSHGGRVNIRIPMVAEGEEQHAFFNWLTGGQKVREEAGMHRRTAATHRLAIDKGEGGKFKEKGGFGAAIRAGLRIETGHTEHFGLDLPVGGLGNKDMNGRVILPNGGYGHLYIGYKPPSTQRDGGLLIGCETDAPGMTNFLGHKHTAKATAAAHGPTGGLKIIGENKKVGKGDMLVDLAAMKKQDGEWMSKLKDMESDVQAGKIKAKELVGKRQ